MRLKIWIAEVESEKIMFFAPIKRAKSQAVVETEPPALKTPFSPIFDSTNCPSGNIEEHMTIFLQPNLKTDG